MRHTYPIFHPIASHALSKTQFPPLKSCLLFDAFKLRNGVIQNQGIVTNIGWKLFFPPRFAAVFQLSRSRVSSMCTRNPTRQSSRRFWCQLVEFHFSTEFRDTRLAWNFTSFALARLPDAILWGDRAMLISHSGIAWLIPSNWGGKVVEKLGESWVAGRINILI